MKLLDFKQHIQLNSIRERMGAKLIHWESNMSWSSFDPLGFRATLRENGEVDIPFTEIKISDDGTLELFGEKILVYIRDQRFSHDLEYKFHVANCSTLTEAQKNKRYSKYVASTNSNGRFKVNLIHGNSWVEKDKDVKLNVCKRCLDALNYKNYRQSYRTKQEVYNSFDIDEFFSLYKKQSIKKPKFTDVTAPMNNYTQDFTKISNHLKSLRGYTCEKCLSVLTIDKKYLHVHHIDGIKSNNSLENLKVLCIHCHANEAGHSHIKLLPDFRDFLIKYGDKEKLNLYQKI